MAGNEFDWRLAVLFGGVAGIIFLFVFLAEWATVFRGGKVIARRREALRGNVLEAYRIGLLNGLDSFARFIGDYHEDGRSNVWSAQSYLFCLGLAVIYPIVFMMSVWALGSGPSEFGDMQLFADIQPSWRRVLILFGTLALITIAAVLRFFEFPGIVRSWARRIVIVGAFVVAGAGGLIGGAVILAFAGVFASIAAGAFAGAGVFIFAVVIVSYAAFSDLANAFLVGAVDFAGGVGFFIALAAVFSFFVYVVHFVANAALDVDGARRGRVWMLPLLGLTALALPLSLTVADPAIDGINLAPEIISEGDLSPFALLFFLVFLPALNAPFDWLSLAISRTLVRWTATVRHGWLSILSWPIVGGVVRVLVILLDFAVAVVLSVLIVAATTAGVAGLNAVHSQAGGAGMGFTVIELLAEIRADPSAKEFWWIYAMVFSTLIPTLVHVVVVAGAWVGALFRRMPPLPAKLAGAAEAAQSRLFSAMAPAFGLAVLRLAPGFAALVLLWFVLPSALEQIGGWLGMEWSVGAFLSFLLDLADQIAAAME